MFVRSLENFERENTIAAQMSALHLMCSFRCCWDGLESKRGTLIELILVGGWYKFWKWKGFTGSWRLKMWKRKCLVLLSDLGARMRLPVMAGWGAAELVCAVRAGGRSVCVLRSLCIPESLTEAPGKSWWWQVKGTKWHAWDTRRWNCCWSEDKIFYLSLKQTKLQS